MPLIDQSLYATASAFGINQSKKEPVQRKCCHIINRRCPSLGLREGAAAIRNTTLVSGEWPSRTVVDNHVRNGSDGGEWTRCRSPRPQRPRCSLKVGPMIGRTGCCSYERALRVFCEGVEVWRLLAVGR